MISIDWEKYLQIMSLIKDFHPGYEEFLQLNTKKGTH